MAVLLLGHWPHTADVAVCRLDKSVNTLTTERALLALVALWHRVPFCNSTWSWPSLLSSLGWGSAPKPSDNPLKTEVDGFFEAYYEEAHHRRHMGVFEGSSLTDVIMHAGKGFDWGSLPAEAGRQGERQIKWRIEQLAKLAACCNTLDHVPYKYLKARCL